MSHRSFIKAWADSTNNPTPNDLMVTQAPYHADWCQPKQNLRPRKRRQNMQTQLATSCSDSIIFANKNRLCILRMQAHYPPATSPAQAAVLQQILGNDQLVHRRIRDRGLHPIRDRSTSQASAKIARYQLTAASRITSRVGRFEQKQKPLAGRLPVDIDESHLIQEDHEFMSVADIL